MSGFVHVVEPCACCDAARLVFAQAVNELERLRLGREVVDAALRLQDVTMAYEAALLEREKPPEPIADEELET